MFLDGEETDPFIGWNPLTGSPILKYSHRNRTDTRPVSFLYPPSLRYLLPISTPFFPYISFSPLPSLRIDELRSGLQRRKRKDTIPSFQKSNFNEANDHSRLFTFIEDTCSNNLLCFSTSISNSLKQR